MTAFLKTCVLLFAGVGFVGCGGGDPLSGTLSGGNGTDRTSDDEGFSVERTSGSNSGEKTDAAYTTSYDTDLQLYIDRFIDRAEYFGFEIDQGLLDSLTFQYDNDLSESEDAVVLGVCDYVNTELYILHPDNYEPAGLALPSKNRFERVIFHELGHCLLLLPHISEDITFELFGRVVDVPEDQRVMYASDETENNELDNAYWRHSQRALFHYGAEVQNDEKESLIDLISDLKPGVTKSVHPGCMLIH